MRNPIKIVLLILTFISCKHHSETKAESHKEIAELRLENYQDSFQQTDSIPEQWNFMVFEKGGCLGGEQYISDQTFQREPKRLVFSEIEWKNFAKNDKTKLTEFLVGKLADTTKTKIHTCPFFGATNGEMAIYSLQHIHNKNWFDFAEFEEYKNKEYESATDQPQMWLQKILKNETKRKKLAELYRNKLKK
ncbi:hypothetical protein [Mangrovimonas sp. TPBH4]|uniref:hypothetical protein n=1 Tax=Mangrovimonas sp. TPBH4 TaxID=1645914 RepID=UPI0006B640B6|nr:hypothetical protein [Mangrovimonas sp. TPBH4]